MVIYKGNKTGSVLHKNFIQFYNNKNKSHKIYVEYNLLDYIEYKELWSELYLDNLLKKRCRNLYFDTYDATSDIVFEVDGIQHYVFTPFFHKDIGSLDRQQTNDRIKETICDFYSTNIIRIRSEKDFERI